MSGFRQAALVIGACVPLLSASAQTQPEHAGHSIGEHFGTVHFPISCSPDAQRQFDRAVAMLHSFFFPETVKAFTAIAQAEPSCAMAYWGVAISQRPNPLLPPFPKTLLQAGWEAIEKARAAIPPTQRERDWIEALGVFFESYDTLDQKTRTAKYEAAMAKLHERYPQDSEAAVFYALALNEAVDLTDKSYSRQLKAAAILNPLARAQPDHPGIVHLIIHSYDYAPIAAKGLPAARRYATLAPSAPHALHMPSHIFSTLGMWQDAIRSDLAADESAKRYALATAPQLAAKPAANPYRYHSLDFLTNAYLQLAQDKHALAIVEQRNSVAELSPDFRYSAHTAFAAIPVRYAIERGAWAEAAQLSPPHTPYPQAEAITWFGRALGAARSADLDGARRDVESIVRLRAQLAAAQDSYWTEQLDIQAEAARRGSHWASDAWIRRLLQCAQQPIARIVRKRASPWRTGSRRCASCWVSCCWRPADPRRRCTNSSFRSSRCRTDFARWQAQARPPPKRATKRRLACITGSYSCSHGMQRAIVHRSKPRRNSCQDAEHTAGAQ